VKYVGVCYDSGQWGGDLSGLLVAEFPDGWFVVASHISSNATWAEDDIKRHYEHRVDPSPDDTYEWAGLTTREQQNERFGWRDNLSQSSATPPAAETET
jgi:hypothetical protein